MATALMTDTHPQTLDCGHPTPPIRQRDRNGQWIGPPYAIVEHDHLEQTMCANCHATHELLPFITRSAPNTRTVFLASDDGRQIISWFGATLMTLVHWRDRITPQRDDQHVAAVDHHGRVWVGYGSPGNPVVLFLTRMTYGT